jgi:pimeloyl-ACP methyl ester carboxylesterase
VEQLLGPPGDGYRDACPRCLPAPTGPVVVVHGTDDTHVPVALSRSYAAAHPGTRLQQLPGVGHFEVVDPQTGAGRHVLGLLRDIRDAAGSPPP